MGRFLLIREHGAAKLGRIIEGRRVGVEGPPTTRNGVVAIDPHTIRSDVGWDRSLAGTNDDMSQLGVMPSCGGVGRSTESDQKAYCRDRTHCIFYGMAAPIVSAIDQPATHALPAHVGKGDFLRAIRTCLVSSGLFDSSRAGYGSR
jgi:hypothetical protein